MMSQQENNLCKKSSGGNRVTNDGMDNYVRLWTTLDETMGYVLASQK